MGIVNHFIHCIKLSLFLFWLLFLSGRIGLFLHEFAGHALFCRLMGGRLAEFSLFVFGGGRVHCSHAPSTVNLSVSSLLAVDLSGMAVELAVGVLLAILSIIVNTSQLIRALLASASSVLIVHSLFYLTICAYYGSGDGTLLFAILQGFIRQLFLSLIFGLTVAGAFLVSYAFSPIVRSWAIDYPLKKGFLTILGCALGAAMLHGALTVGEQIVIQDKVYDEIKTSQNVKLKEEELSGYIAGYTQEHGRAPDQELMAMVDNELERKYWQFPIEIPLGIAIVAAFVAGFFFSKRRDDDDPSPVAWKDVILLGSFSIVVAILILILNRNIHV